MSNNIHGGLAQGGDGGKNETTITGFDLCSVLLILLIIFIVSNFKPLFFGDFTLLKICSALATLKIILNQQHFVTRVLRETKDLHVTSLFNSDT